MLRQDEMGRGRVVGDKSERWVGPEQASFAQ